MPFGTRRSCLMKKTGDEKSRDTVPLSQNMWLIHTHRASRCTEFIVESPLTSMADNFPEFLLETDTAIFSANRLQHYRVIAEISIQLLICSNCSGKLIPAINRIVVRQFLLSADWIAANSYLHWLPH